MDLSENAILRDYAQPPLCSGPFLSNKAIAAFTDRLIADHDVKAPGRWAKLRTLSGGNQQKLLLARELAGQPRLIVAVHPTRGVDVGATEAIHAGVARRSGRAARPPSSSPRTWTSFSRSQIGSRSSSRVA